MEWKQEAWENNLSAHIRETIRRMERKQSTAAKGAEQTSMCIELPLCEKIAAYL
jgi:hypothetical protein